MKLDDLTQIIYEQGEKLGIWERLFCQGAGHRERWNVLSQNQRMMY